MSRRPTATILKLIKGDKEKSRHRDDHPKINAPPLIPPGTDLTPAERAVWDYLIEHVYMPGVHGTADGAAFVKVARLYARVNEADAKINAHGLVMKNAKTNKPELQPYTRLSRDLWQQLGIALAEIGATPAGRFKIAGHLDSSPDATSWDDID